MSDVLDVEIRPGWRLSSGRSLFLEQESTLVIADIHWGYAASHRRMGNLLPIWGDREISQRLLRLLGHYQPARMIWLGDSLHTRHSAGAAEDFLEALSPKMDVVILAGNHDRSWPRADREEYRVADFLFHHGDRAREIEPPCIEIIGHLHPAIAWSDGAGLRLKLPALVEGTRRLIMPSFSDWSAGLPWNGRLEPDEKLWLISPRKIWAAAG